MNHWSFAILINYWSIIIIIALKWRLIKTGGRKKLFKQRTSGQFECIMRHNSAIRIYDFDFMSLLLLDFAVIFPSKKNNQNSTRLIYLSILLLGNLCLSRAINIKVPTEKKEWKKTKEKKNSYSWWQKRKRALIFYMYIINDVIDWIEKSFSWFRRS